VLDMVENNVGGDGTFGILLEEAVAIWLVETVEKIETNPEDVDALNGSDRDDSPNVLDAVESDVGRDDSPGLLLDRVATVRLFEMNEETEITCVVPEVENSETADPDGVDPDAEDPVTKLDAVEVRVEEEANDGLAPEVDDGDDLTVDPEPTTLVIEELLGSIIECVELRDWLVGKVVSGRELNVMG